MSYFRHLRAYRYLFFEMLPSFLMGVFIFIFIILMFQSYRLTEYVIVHGASLYTILEILFYLSVSFLPIVMPMSLLFSILLTYGRLSADSEIVAFKALGLNIIQLALPAIFLSLFISLFSAQTSYYVAPWGNRQMEILVHKLGESKPSITIREGVFSEDFFNMVVYVNKINPKDNLLNKVFIYDERNSSSPLTIIAQEGKLIQESSLDGQKAFLRLFSGNIHRTHDDVYTKIDFKTYDINLYDPVSYSHKQKTPLSYNIEEIKRALHSKKTPPDLRKDLEVEFHRRSALSVLCFLFALIGVGMGTVTNRRAAKGNGFILSIGLVVAYWMLYAFCENLSKSGTLPMGFGIWLPNIIFLLIGLRSLRQASN